MAYKLFANHCHVFPDGAKDNAQIRNLKQLMQECGIEKAVCFTCFQDQYDRCGVPGDPNTWLYNEIKDDPTLVGFGTVNFDRDDITEQVEYIASLGFKGIKIHPAYQEVNIMGDKARKVYAKAEELGLFLSFHTGLHWHRLADYNVLLFDEVAWHYPRLRFSMEHIGGYHFFREALAVICNNRRAAEYPTVYAGWTSVGEEDEEIQGGWHLSDVELRTVIKQTGNDHSTFGLDFPYNDADDTKRFINRIKNMDIPEEAKEGILGKNLADALGIEL